MKLFYKKVGKGKTIVIAHGLYGSSDNWMSIANALSNQYELILVDMRNHGNSPHHPEHTYPALANDLLELFHDLHLESPILLGHSMGGKAAMQLAIDHPNTISKLVIVDIAPTSYIQEGSIAPQAVEHNKIIAAMQALPISELRSRSEAEEILGKTIHPLAVVRFLLKNLNRDENDNFFWKLNLGVLSQNIDNLMGDLSFATKNEHPAAMPTLFIKGELSPYIDLVQDTEIIHKLFLNANIVTIPNAGHWVHSEQPKLFLKRLSDFLTFS